MKRNRNVLTITGIMLCAGSVLFSQASPSASPKADASQLKPNAASNGKDRFAATPTEAKKNNAAVKKQPAVKTANEPALSDTDKRLTAAADKIIPSVVSVRVVRLSAENSFSSVHNPAFPYNAPASRPTTILSGSGIILDKRGNIATNYHVVQNAKAIHIQLYDLREYSCELVGADPVTDVAVIRISLNVPPDLSPAQFADSSKVRTGQLAVAVGNSWGYHNTVTMGIISSTGRAGNSFAESGDFLQTDAALNPGNSGGALSDVNGRIVGMNTAVYARTGGTAGLGFSIPSNSIKDLSAKIIAQGMVIRGWSGMLIQDMNPDLALKYALAQKGAAYVTDTVKGSPAAASGIMTGDIVISADGKPVTSARSLHERVLEKKPGDKITLTIMRSGKKIEINMFMGNSPDAALDGRGPGKLSAGLGVSDVDEDASIRFGIHDRNGVVVVRLDTGSAAESSGIEMGDLITELDGKAVPTLDDFSRIMGSAVKRSSFVVMLKRKGSQRYVTVYLR